MYILSDKTRKHLVDALLSQYYAERVQYLTEFLTISRANSNKTDPMTILRLQKDCATFETQLWKVMAEERKILKGLKDNNPLETSVEIEGLEKQLFFHQQLIRISKTICDGIAWRNLSYSRLFMEAAARGWTSGGFDLNLPSTKSLFDWALAIVESHKSIVIINDLIRYLRHGDLTECYQGVGVMHELKKDGKKIINFKTVEEKKKGKLSLQTRRLMELQDVAFGKKLQLADGTIFEQELCQTECKTYHEQIYELISNARHQVVSRRQIEPFLIVSIIDFNKAVLRSEKMKKYMKTFNYDPWGEKALVIPHTSWDHFYSDDRGNFLRSIVPYSIYPFDDITCMDLMSGRILIQSFFNISIFAQELANRRWEVRIIEPQPEKFAEQAESLYNKINPLFSEMGPEGYIEVHRGGFGMTIPGSWLTMITMEFMTFDTLVSLLEEAYQKTVLIRDSWASYPEFRNLSSVWN